MGSEMCIRDSVVAVCDIDLRQAERAKAAFGAPVALHRDDLFLYEAVVQHALAFGLRVEPQPPPDRFYAPGEAVRFGRLGRGSTTRQGIAREGCACRWARSASPAGTCSSATPSSRAPSDGRISPAETTRP